MELKNQVNNVEQGKRLTELGITEPSYFSWCDYPNISCIRASNPEIFITEDIDGLYSYVECSKEAKEKTYPAFTVAELFVMLPKYVRCWHGNNVLGEMGWMCSDRGREVISNECAYNTQAEACASCLIHLLETNKLPASECNEALKNG